MTIELSHVKAAAQGRWTEILTHLGIDVSHLKNRHGPCPGCGGRDRFRFDNLAGRGTWVCGGSGQEQAGDGFQLLEHVYGWSRAESFKAVAETLGLTDGTEPPPPRKAPAKPLDNGRQIRQAEAARLARTVINAAPLAEISHPYLITKQLPSQRDEQTPANPFPTLYQIPIKKLVELIGYHPKGRAGHLDGTILIAPVGDWDGITTLEMIDETGRKSILSGSKKAGCWWAAQAMPEAPTHLLIGEGIATVLSACEATGWPGVAALSCGNLKSVAQAMRQRYPETKIIILADLGNGQGKAEEAAKAIGGRLAVPDFGVDRSEAQTDFNDLAKDQGLEVIREQIKHAKKITTTRTTVWEKPGFEKVTNLDRVIDALAELKPIEYDPYRKPIAKQLDIRSSTLDTVVEDRRRELEEAQTGNDILAPLPEPWTDPVDGAALLDEIRAYYERYLVLPDHAAEALALWTLGTYVYDVFRIWPKLLVTSPEKRCGKSTLRETMEAMARQAMPTSNITPAALFRTIDLAKPTITIDEADTFLTDNDDLRGIINSGHARKGAFVIRCDGDDNQPKRFSTWAPMVIFMIKLPADTIVDRSIVIQLRRKLPGERVERLPQDLDERCLPIRRRCVRWAEDNEEKLKRAVPDMPQHGNDRALDNWLPLFAIAEAAGGEWTVKVRLAFNGLETLDEDDGIGPLILRDIRTVFTERRIERMFSRELVDALTEIEESPWAEWQRGKPLTQNSLARLLKPFGIRPHEIRIGPDHAKGYELDQFLDAFARYIDDRTETNGEKQESSPDHPFQTATS